MSENFVFLTYLRVPKIHFSPTRHPFFYTSFNFAAVIFCCCFVAKEMRILFPNRDVPAECRLSVKKLVRVCGLFGVRVYTKATKIDIN